MYCTVLYLEDGPDEPPLLLAADGPGRVGPVEGFLHQETGGPLTGGALSLPGVLLNICTINILSVSGSAWSGTFF